MSGRLVGPHHLKDQGPASIKSPRRQGELWAGFKADLSIMRIIGSQPVRLAGFGGAFLADHSPDEREDVPDKTGPKPLRRAVGCWWF